MSKETIARNLTYHKPTDEQDSLYQSIRAKGRELAELIEDKCPGSREKSLAMTKLEECVMWANASVARNISEGDAS